MGCCRSSKSGNPNESEERRLENYLGGEEQIRQRAIESPKLILPNKIQEKTTEIPILEPFSPGRILSDDFRLTGKHIPYSSTLYTTYPLPPYRPSASGTIPDLPSGDLPPFRPTFGRIFGFPTLSFSTFGLPIIGNKNEEPPPFTGTGVSHCSCKNINDLNNCDFPYNCCTKLVRFVFPNSPPLSIFVDYPKPNEPYKKGGLGFHFDFNVTVEQPIKCISDVNYPKLVSVCPNANWGFLQLCRINEIAHYIKILKKGFEHKCIETLLEWTVDADLSVKSSTPPLAWGPELIKAGERKSHTFSDTPVTNLRVLDYFLTSARAKKSLITYVVTKCEYCNNKCVWNALFKIKWCFEYWIDIKIMPIINELLPPGFEFKTDDELKAFNEIIETQHIEKARSSDSYGGFVKSKSSNLDCKKIYLDISRIPAYNQIYSNRPNCSSPYCNEKTLFDSKWQKDCLNSSISDNQKFRNWGDPCSWEEPNLNPP